MEKEMIWLSGVLMTTVRTDFAESEFAQSEADNADKSNSPLNRGGNAIDPTSKYYAGPEPRQVEFVDWLDLNREPWVPGVPAIAGNRHYVFQRLDLLAYGFTYVGSCSTADGVGHYSVRRASTSVQ